MQTIAELTPIQRTKYCTGSELERLTVKFPVERSLGRLYQLLRDGKLKPGYGEELFRESAAASPEAERFLGELLAYSVQRDRFQDYQRLADYNRIVCIDDWVGYAIGWNPEKIGYVKDNMDKPESVSEGSRGMILARDAGLLSLAVAVGKVYAAPTEQLILFAIERIEALFSQDQGAIDVAIKKLMKDERPGRV